MEIHQIIKAAVEDSGLEIQYRPKFAGRGMYGRECVAIVGGQRDCMKIIGEAIKEAADSTLVYGDDSDEFEGVVDTLLDFEQDLLGLCDTGVVIYWRDLEDDSEEEDLVDDDED